MGRGDRNESWSDAALGLAPFAPPGLRRWAARRAAARGLGAPALRAAPSDPWVLSRLGLHAAALETRATGVEADLARAASAAALGRSLSVAGWLDRFGAASAADRRFLAAAAAPADARLSLALLPRGDTESRAACALALGDVEATASLLASAPASQQARYLAAALAAHLAVASSAPGGWVRARLALNAAFGADGLAPPLDARVDRPSTLDAFGAGTPAGGTVDGPLVSVVMAARDAERTLDVAVRSMLAQSWRSLEVIVIDDGSTDATASLARAMSERDPRLRVISNDRAPGAYGARNAGLAAARGDFVALQDADDWAHPQRLERQMAILRSAGLTLCRHFRLDMRGVPFCPRVFPFVRLSPITMTARKEAFLTLGPFEEVPTGADSEWVARFDERFGRRAAPRAVEVGLIALWAAGSLSASPASGLIGGGAPARVAYVESWRRRHAAAWRAPFAPAGNTG